MQITENTLLPIANLWIRRTERCNRKKENKTSI